MLPAKPAPTMKRESAIRRQVKADHAAITEIVQHESILADQALQQKLSKRRLHSNKYKNSQKGADSQGEADLTTSKHKLHSKSTNVGERPMSINVSSMSGLSGVSGVPTDSPFASFETAEMSMPSAHSMLAKSCTHESSQRAVSGRMAETSDLHSPRDLSETRAPEMLPAKPVPTMNRESVIRRQVESDHAAIAD